MGNAGLAGRTACWIWTMLLLCGSTSTVFADSVTYDHDPVTGRLTKATYDDGTVVDYLYDDNGNRTDAIVTPPADTSAPTPPAGLSATSISTSQIDLAWSPSSDNRGVAAYAVERCQGVACAGFSFIGEAPGTTYSDGGLAEGTTYRYRVRARDASGNYSAYSGSVGAETIDATAPGAPTTLVATAASETQVNLSWLAPSDNVGVTGYRIERCEGTSCSGFGQIASIAGTSYPDTGRLAGRTYRYRVRAVDAAGNHSGYSNVATATTLDSTPPSPPSGLAGTPQGESQVSLSWTGATDNVGVTAYLIERCVGSGCANFVQIASPSSTTYVDGGRSAATAYRYRVRARDAAGLMSSYSNVITVTTLDSTPPTNPTNLSAAASTESQVNLNWTASSDNVGVTHYLIERCTGSGCGGFAQIGTSAGTSYADGGRAPATTYRYRVRAVDGASLTSGYSNVAAAVTPDITPPSQAGTPSFSSITITSATASWPAATDNVAVSGYEYRLNAGATWTNVGSALSISLGGLTLGTSYNFQVRAYDAAGNRSTAIAGSFSTLADTIPPSVPGMPAASIAGDYQVNLTWSASSDSGGSGLAGYRVYRNGTLLGSTSATSMSDTGVAPFGAYSYTVVAYDGSNNTSSSSAAGTVAVAYQITDAAGALVGGAASRYSRALNCSASGPPPQNPISCYFRVTRLPGTIVVNAAKTYPPGQYPQSGPCGSPTVSIAPGYLRQSGCTVYASPSAYGP